MTDQTPKYNLTAPGPLETALMQAGNGAFLGYLPEVVGMLPGSKPEDVEKVRQGLAMGDAANPKSSWAGFGAGLIGPGMVAKAGWKYMAKPVLKAALGLAADAGLGTVAKAAAGKVGAALGLSGLGLGGYQLFGGESGTAPAPAAGTQPAAANQKTAGTQQAEPRKTDWYDEMSGVTGLSRDTLKGMVQQEGGIRLSTLQTLNGMKGRTPTPQQQAISRLDNMFAGQIAQARASGDAQRSRELETLYSQIMAGVATSDDMIGSEVARVLNGD